MAPRARLDRATPALLALLALLAAALPAPPAAGQAGQAGGAVCGVVDATCRTTVDAAWSPEIPRPRSLLDAFVVDVEVVYGYDATNAPLAEGQTSIEVRLLDPDGRLDVEPASVVMRVPLEVDGSLGWQEVTMRTGFLLRCRAPGPAPLLLNAQAAANGGYLESEASGEVPVACPERAFAAQGGPSGGGADGPGGSPDPVEVQIPVRPVPGAGPAPLALGVLALAAAAGRMRSR